MTGKIELIKDFFNHWRQDNAKKEEDILLTAIDFVIYLEDGVDLKKINEEFIDTKSPKYNALDRYRKRGFGALVYCKFILQEYLKNLTTANMDEIAVLEKIAQNLEDLYLSSRTETQKKINNLTDSYHLWLSNYARAKLNDRQIQPLCYSLYILLKILNISLKGLDSWSKGLARPFIDLGWLDAEVEGLLTETRDTLSLLEMEMERNKRAGDSPPENLTEYFNQRYLQLINQHPIYSYDCLEESISLLEHALRQVEKLGQLLKKRELIKAKIKSTESLLAVLEENERRIIGRKYFLELIAENNALFQELLNNTIEGTSLPLLKKIEQLKNPDNYQKLSSSVQYVTSWATILPTSALRLAVPQTWQESVVNSVPATLDSECKQELKVVAERCLKELKHELLTTKDNPKLTAEVSVSEQEQYEKFIHTASSETVSDLLTTSESMLKSLSEYKKLLKLTRITQQKFTEIKALDESTQEFLQQHDSLWTRLLSFLAKLFSFFNTETVKLVDRVRKIQSELPELKEEHHTSFQSECETAKKNMIIFPPLKECLIERAKVVVKLTGNEKRVKNKTQDIHHSFNLIEQGFFRLKQDLSELTPQSKNDEKNSLVPLLSSQKIL
ncbi:hypothetical protein [Legionella cardiaca]|uniref:Purine NTPase n=1 Tax=Legionella cardiaca TaxID=1071983 RepID=A0ABY8AP88_9GAMM|nr:hypothetical protein [Legionella cardiaca]WED42450.1 hypothetical protein PXX05_11055 [Legionella cardiaca]